MFTGGLDQPEMWKCFFKKRQRGIRLSGFENIETTRIQWEYSNKFQRTTRS